MRRRDVLTAEHERELEALDRALAGEPVALELRELEQLVGDIRATAPQMRPAFAARLEHEVRQGFATPREQPSRLGGRRRRWLLLPAAGTLAALAVALVVVLGAGTGVREPPSDTADSAAPQSAAGRGADSADEAAGVAAAPAPSTPSAARPAPAPAPPVASTQAPRRVQRSASIALETPAGDFEKTTAAVSATVARFAGIVASSHIGEGEASGEATFDLRIPTDRLDRALAALAALGHVSERSQSLADITGSLTAAQERLTDARAERRGLLRALERATTRAQIDSLKARLRSVGGRIRQLERRLASLRRRADLAAVTVTVRGAGERGAAGAGARWTPGDAAGDALRVIEVLAGALLIALAVVVPAGLLGAAIAVGVRLARRRRREAALDPV